MPCRVASPASAHGVRFLIDQNRSRDGVIARDRRTGPSSRHVRKPAAGSAGMTLCSVVVGGRCGTLESEGGRNAIEARARDAVLSRWCPSGAPTVTTTPPPMSTVPAGTAVTACSAGDDPHRGSQRPVVSARSPASASTPLVGHDWVRMPVTERFPLASEPRLVFDPDGTVDGFDGCDEWSDIVERHRRAHPIRDGDGTDLDVWVGPAALLDDVPFAIALDGETLRLTLESRSGTSPGRRLRGDRFVASCNRRVVDRHLGDVTRRAADHGAGRACPLRVVRRRRRLDDRRRSTERQRVRHRPGRQPSPAPAVSCPASIGDSWSSWRRATSSSMLTSTGPGCC